MDGNAKATGTAAPGNAANGNAQKKGGGMLLPAAAIIVIIILAAAALLYLGHPSPSSQHGLSSVLAPGSTVTANEAFSTISRGINSTNTINATYSGTAQLSVVSNSTSSLGLSLSFSAAFEMDLMKYYNSTRISVSATNVPIIGNISSVFVGVNKTTTYSCSRSYLSSNKSYQCIRHNVSAISQFINLSSSSPNPVSSTSPLSALNTTKLKVVDLRSYRGQQCLFMTGSGNTTLNSTPASPNPSATKVYYNLSTCVSNSQYIPLNLTASGSSKSALGNFTIKLSINETGSGTFVSKNEVVSLPGPVVNSSLFGIGSINIPSNSSYNNTIISSGYSASASDQACGNLTITARNSHTNTTFCNWAGGYLEVRSGLGIQNGAYYYLNAQNGTSVLNGYANSCSGITTPATYVPKGTYEYSVTAGTGSGQCTGNDFATLIP